MENLAVQPDGKVLVGGNLGWPVSTPKATLDAGFGNGGVELRVPTTLKAQTATSALVTVLPNGNFLAIGAGANPTTGALELIFTRYFH